MKTTRVIFLALFFTGSMIPTGASTMSETKLLPFDGSAGDEFGGAVSFDGETLVVGARCNDDWGSESGSVYVFVRSGAEWSLEAKLTPGHPAAGARFGTAVAVDGDTVLVGAYRDGRSGSVYVFTRSAGEWSLEAKLTPSDEGRDERFGASVSLSGDTAVIGAYLDSPRGRNSGSAYVFRRSVTEWIEEAKLIASDGSLNDYFGWSVAVDGDIALVGAYGDDAAYVFRYDGNDWTEEQRLTPIWSGGACRFGISVALDFDTAVVGAYGDCECGYHAGAAHVFWYDGTEWVGEQKLTASDGANSDRFGISVGIDADRIVIGAQFDDHGGRDTGSAYLYRRDGAAWVQESKLSPRDAASYDGFGRSVSLSGESVVIGAIGDDDHGSNSGSAYAFGPNNPPKAEAGAGGDTECASLEGSLVTLDGSASTDPDSSPGTNDDIASFEWFEDYGLPTEELLGVGELIDVTLPLGRHEITLRVTDRAGAEDTDETVHSVVDTTPPGITVILRPDTLWPPNHRMVEVNASVDASDICAVPEVSLASIASSEPDDAQGNGDGNTSRDIQNADLGAADFAFSLRAERSGAGDGRSYTVVYTAVDSAGNKSDGLSVVTVPHSRGGKSDPLDLTVNEGQDGTVVSWSLVEGALHYNVIRGGLSEIVETGAVIELGSVFCIEAGSLDDSSNGWEDRDDPPPGEGFFYLVEYDDGSRSSYGSESARKPRVVSSGDCHP